MAARARLWYTRRGSQVRGPFHVGLIQRYLVLGRLSEDDDVSVDRKSWARISQVPELAAPGRPSRARDPELRERLLAAKRWADERLGNDRREEHDGAPAGAERRHGERRAQEPDGPPQVRPRRNHRAAAANGPRGNALGIAVVLAIAGVFVGLTLTVKPAATAKGPDCRAPARPGVNWANCHLQGTHLAGADLHGANLKNADLTGMDLAGANLAGADLAFAKLGMSDLHGADLNAARLKGANLTGANLGGADLRRADLSYATLRQALVSGTRLEGAILVDAIWVDEGVCGPGSVGACRASAIGR